MLFGTVKVYIKEENRRIRKNLIKLIMIEFRSLGDY